MGANKGTPLWGSKVISGQVSCQDNLVSTISQVRKLAQILCLVYRKAL